MKFYLFVKRAFDIINAILGIIIFSPVFIIVGLLVLFSSKGPIIFSDERIGKNGKQIKVFKFRTMHVDAESNLTKYLTETEKEKWDKERKLDDDPRVTRIGHMLRKTSLDELPQLFNILFGSMSFVGPRPITQKEIEENFTQEEAKIYSSVRPGLISEWGVNGRNNITYTNHERQDLELAYFKKRSFMHDVALFLKAVPAVISQKGAK